MLYSLCQVSVLFFCLTLPVYYMSWRVVKLSVVNLFKRLAVDSSGEPRSASKNRSRPPVMLFLQINSGYSCCLLSHHHIYPPHVQTYFSFFFFFSLDNNSGAVVGNPRFNSTGAAVCFNNDHCWFNSSNSSVYYCYWFNHFNS